MSQAQQDLGLANAKLQQENEALKARIRLIEEGQTKDLTILVGQKVDESQEISGKKWLLGIRSVFSKRYREFLESKHSNNGEQTQNLFKIAGAMVKGGDSKAEGCEFESRRRIPYVHLAL